MDLSPSTTVAALFSLLTLACGSRVLSSATEGDTQTSTSSTPSTSISSSPISSSTLASTTSGSGTGTESSTSGGKEIGERCDIFAQNCAPGLKCGPSVADWCDNEEQKCFPIADPPDEIDQRCTLDPPCGIDTCTPGNFCYWHETNDGEGTCMTFCDFDHPCTRPREECLRLTGFQNVCVTRCSPLLQDCPGDLVCHSLGSGRGVGCLAPTPLPGVLHTPCDFNPDCQAGLACVYAPNVCATRCCSPFCDVTDPNACDQIPNATCSPLEYFDPSPETENLGVCV